MSQHLDKMVLGDCILAKGPKGRFTYARNMKRHIGAPPASIARRALAFRHHNCPSDPLQNAAQHVFIKARQICCRHGGGGHRHHADVAGGEPHPQ
jgi:hypothetical protein